MRRWVITGPMGAGKSAAVARLRDRHGAGEISGDELGHRVLAMPEVMTSLERAFGPDVLRDGQVDRGVLGRRVFADPEAMAILNGLTHGRICRLAEAAFAEMEAGGKHSLAVLEAAVYFLFPDPPRVDLVVAVLADYDVREARLLGDRNLTADQIVGRLQAQRHLDGFWPDADVIIDNAGTVSDLADEIDRLVAQHPGDGPQ